MSAEAFAGMLGVGVLLYSIGATIYGVDRRDKEIKSDVGKYARGEKGKEEES